MIRPLLWLPLAALSLAPALAQEQTLKEQAEALHALAGGAACDVFEGGFVPEDSYKEWSFTYQPSWSDDAEDAEELTLIRIFCGAGAYNLQHAYYLNREYEGLMPLGFAMPTYDVKYENEDDIDSPLESVTLTGMGAQTILVNSDFDPETMTIAATSLWRGIGDASSTGTWVFLDGEFSLQRYDVDASYDGEMNSEVLVDYGTTPKTKGE